MGGGEDHEKKVFVFACFLCRAWAVLLRKARLFPWTQDQYAEWVAYAQECEYI